MTEHNQGNTPRWPLKISIATLAVGEPVGFDSAIINVPGGWYATVGGKPALLAQVAGRDLREVSEVAAANIGEKLHRAEWVITSDPAEVKTLGLMHDCATCRAGVDRALAFLRDTPGGEVAVGQLWWAGPANRLSAGGCPLWPGAASGSAR